MLSTTLSTPILLAASAVSPMPEDPGDAEGEAAGGAPAAAALAGGSGSSEGSRRAGRAGAAVGAHQPDACGPHAGWPWSAAGASIARS